MATNDQSGVLTRIGTWTSHPAAFVVVALYAAAWLVFAPEELDWHSVATLATWLMTLFIQRAEHRDTQAIQAKLDELLRASGGAENELTHIDEKEPEAIEREREVRDGNA
jgi:low affinity Fe/Cu permease